MQETSSTSSSQTSASRLLSLLLVLLPLPKSPKSPFPIVLLAQFLYSHAVHIGDHPLLTLAKERETDEESFGGSGTHWQKFAATM